MILFQIKIETKKYRAKRVGTEDKNAKIRIAHTYNIFGRSKYG